MVEINEGQIYQRPNGAKLLITNSTPVREKILNEKVEGLYCYITPFGYTSHIAVVLLFVVGSILNTISLLYLSCVYKAVSEIPKSLS